MTKPLSASSVERHRLSVVAILGICCLTLPLRADPLNKLPPGFGNRAPKNGGEVAGRRSTSAPTYQASYAPSTPSGHLEARVGLLAKNDQRQDLRLMNLEKDVNYLGKIADSGSRGPATRGTYKPPAPPSPSKFYTVRAGDTLWRIASKHRVSINDIRSANRMSRDTVMVGQALVIPGTGPAESTPSGGPAGVHIVKPGDTFSEIAQTYRVAQEALARANPVVDRSRLLIGTRLVLPGKDQPSPAAAHPPTPSPAPAPLSPSAQILTHSVRAGESLGAIAKSYGVPTASVAAANKLKNPNLLMAGQRLIIPAKDPNGPVIANAAPMPPAPLSLVADPDITSEPRFNAPTPPPASTAAPDLTAVGFTPSAPERVVSKPASMPNGAHRGVLAYRLERGDTLETVANMFSTTAQKIREMNNLTADAEVKEGDEVVVPAMGPVSLN